MPVPIAGITASRVVRAVGRAATFDPAETGPSAAIEILQSGAAAET
ncbi:hypothetical protein [Bradyrhizobium sp.]|nr:hypothetical protein [Bradyrhizobium sp.]MDO9296926.1 hypothetical protein [Bradyrhizobium sp.]